MDEIARLKEEILKDYPRLSPADEFTFACHKGVACFNSCCSDVNIFLTPYDIVRLRRALGISSGEFLKKYTLMPSGENLDYPVVQLKMDEDAKKTCPFVTDQGCRVYADRPWPCRMYPLGLASSEDEGKEDGNEFYFVLEDSDCKGFEEKKTWKVAGWLVDQGISDYNQAGREFKTIILHRYFKRGQRLTPQKAEMFVMACYDIDRFREFLFKSSFLDKFIVDKQTRKSLKNDDVELLGFAYDWLRFALFGEKTLTVRGDILEAKRQELDVRGGERRWI